MSFDGWTAGLIYFQWENFETACTHDVTINEVFRNRARFHIFMNTYMRQGRTRA